MRVEVGRPKLAGKFKLHEFHAKTHTGGKSVAGRVLLSFSPLKGLGLKQLFSGLSKKKEGGKKGSVFLSVLLLG